MNDEKFPMPTIMHDDRQQEWACFRPDEWGKALFWISAAKGLSCGSYDDLVDLYRNNHIVNRLIDQIIQERSKRQ